MENKTIEYEIFYLVLDSKKNEFARISEMVAKAVVAAGGTPMEGEVSEERKLSYEIQKEYRGIYIARRFSVPGGQSREQEDAPDHGALVTKELKLVGDIARFIIVRADNLPPLAEKQKKIEEQEKEAKKVIKTEGEAIDEKLEKVLNI